MKLSSRAVYGLQAIMDLALFYDTAQAVQVKDIALRQGIPEDYLGQLMVVLRKTGLVRSLRGPSGGYILARPPANITLAEAIEALEGLIDQPGPNTMSGAVYEAWHKAVKAAHQVLESITIEDLCQRQKQLTQAFNYQI